VRSSKFRHVFGKTVRKEDQYENVQVPFFNLPPSTPPLLSRLPAHSICLLSSIKKSTQYILEPYTCLIISSYVSLSRALSLSLCSATPRHQTRTCAMQTLSTSVCRGAAAAGRSWCGRSRRLVAYLKMCLSALATAAQSWTFTSTPLKMSASPLRPTTLQQKYGWCPKVESYEV
jgi:hypothetical protein